MPRDLFGDVQQPSVRVGSRSRYTVPLSLAAHALAVLAVVGATILGPVVLPGLASDDLSYYMLTLPPAPPPPTPPVSVAAARPPVNPNAAPTEAPPDIRPETPRQFELPDVSSAVPGLVPGGNGIDTNVGEPPPPPPPAPRAPVRPGGNIQPPAKVHDVAPIYPALALAARQQGMVILEAIIDTTGRVQSARVLKGVPLLNDAAITAVSRWVYTPTLLNGVPVPVVMTVTVNFQIN
jgi:protein TonB